jgi:hypothetical protein
MVQTVIKFIISVSGLEKQLGAYVDIIDATEVEVTPLGNQRSNWNLDGELEQGGKLTATSSLGAIPIFARGVTR